MKPARRTDLGIVLGGCALGIALSKPNLAFSFVAIGLFAAGIVLIVTAR